MKALPRAVRTSNKIHDNFYLKYVVQSFFYKFFVMSFTRIYLDKWKMFTLFPQKKTMIFKSLNDLVPIIELCLSNLQVFF